MTDRILDLQDKDRFSLDETYLTEYQTKQPDFGGAGLGYVVYKRTYSRTKDDGTSEEWWETIRRVVEGHYSVQKWHCRRNHLPWSERKAQSSAQEMYRLIFEMKMLPPGRGLWAMGTKYIEENGSIPLFNCSVRGTEDIVDRLSGPFSYVADLSMLGVGVGFDTKGAGKVKILAPEVSDDIHIVEDSRQGWVDCMARVIDSYAHQATLPKEIDYSLVRPAGAPLKGFGGVAAGPQPLIDCVAAFHEILSPLIGKRITSTAIVDLMDVIGRCVVAGNVRRSALLAAGDPNDQEFMELKNPDLHQKEMMDYRWASNNSVLAHIGMDYTEAAAQTAKAGEPGYIWLANAKAFGRMGDRKTWTDGNVVATNPCGEIPLESGGLCNLVETFPSRHENFAEYKRTLKYAYLWSKGVTLIPTHREECNQIQLRNRRLGISMTGIVQAMQRHGTRPFLEWCDKGYDYLRELDSVYSDWLGIPRSIKITTVKPSGSVSTLPYVTPGIHFEHSPFYLRRVRIAYTNPLLKKLSKAGYPVEDDAYDKSSAVVSFPIKAEFFDRSKSDVTLWEQMELAAQMQNRWADNAVSVTVTFKPEEAGDIKKALELYETRLKTVSFLPLEDHGYVQAPYQEITEAEYEQAAAKIKPLHLTGNTNDSMDMWCDSDSCEIPVMNAQAVA